MSVIHTVHWTATAPDGVVLEPASGTLKVHGTRGAAAKVTVRATAGAATGAQRIMLDFRLPDGTALFPVRVEVAVS
ncbi:hypothetical protein [Streptomyces sp. NPDC048295]|uniref:hypothetical protein n=1 Tax=Streptomyces sp. NPDC048295 TaxID=3154617 RepID=UPI00343895CE